MSTSRTLNKITKIWFDGDLLYGKDSDGNVVSQSLLWYPELKDASDLERSKYTFGFEGIHWRALDVDISFESFFYSDAIPSPMQRFFLEHREINVAEFAKRIGINPTLLRNYINGFKKPSEEREEMIFKKIRELGEEYMNAFVFAKISE